MLLQALLSWHMAIGVVVNYDRAWTAKACSMHVCPGNWSERLLWGVAGLGLCNGAGSVTHGSGSQPACTWLCSLSQLILCISIHPGITLFMGTCQWMNMETKEVGHTVHVMYTLPPTIGNSGNDGMEVTPHVLLPIVGEDLLALMRHFSHSLGRV